VNKQATQARDALQSAITATLQTRSQVATKVLRHETKRTSGATKIEQALIYLTCIFGD
jgi:hypothetical protein